VVVVNCVGIYRCTGGKSISNTFKDLVSCKRRIPQCQQSFGLKFGLLSSITDSVTIHPRGHNPNTINKEKFVVLSIDGVVIVVLRICIVVVVFCIRRSFKSMCCCCLFQ